MTGCKCLQILMSVLVLAMMAASINAQVPQAINYQGRLTDDQGNPVPDGMYSLNMRIYTSAAGNDSIWWCHGVSVDVTSGLFNRPIGEDCALPHNIFANDTGLWLGIAISGEAEMIPRIKLTSTAFAYHALRSDTAEYSFAGAEGTCEWTLNGSDIYYGDGNVGIGTGIPAHKLDVDGNINTDSVYLIAGDTILQAAGNGNIAVGKGAGVNNSGVYSTFVGADAAPNNQGNGNVMVGRIAGYYHTTGDNNTFVGVEAGYGNIIGDRNTFIGRGAGRDATGSDNVFLGRGAGYGNVDSNKLIIDNGTTGMPLIWGDFVSNSLGIGVDDPESNLEVKGGVTSSGNLAGFKFYDRNPIPSMAWMWWAKSGSARLLFQDPDEQEMLRVTSDGNMGIGTVIPADHRLFVESDGFRVHGATSFFRNTSDSGIALLAENTSDDATAVFLQKGSGDALRCFYVDSGEVWNFLFRVTNSGRAICNELELLGGADMAEPFPISGGAVPAGALVVIDDENPGKLKLSNRAYDTRVAGIASGAGGVNPGLTLSQKEVFEDGQNVAISGRVYCLADASYGSIKPGDLLTTSETPGHAMKATDQGRTYGSVIGKAMSNLSDGRGLVLVLVTLQ